MEKYKTAVSKPKKVKTMSVAYTLPRYKWVKMMIIHGNLAYSYFMF